MATAEPSTWFHKKGWGEQVWKLLMEQHSIIETSSKTARIQIFSWKFEFISVSFTCCVRACLYMCVCVHDSVCIYFSKRTDISTWALAVLSEMAVTVGG